MAAAFGATIAVPRDVNRPRRARHAFCSRVMAASRFASTFAFPTVPVTGAFASGAFDPAGRPDRLLKL